MPATARILVRLAPTWIAIAALAALGIGARLIADGNVAGLVGAYSGVVGTEYDAGEAARWIFYHVGDLFLLVLGVPLVALGVLGYCAARGRESDPGVRALVAVSLATSLWLPVQVGVFASRYVGHLAERDLIIAAPPLFVCLAVWLSRGVPRPQPATSIVAFVVAIPAVFLPIRVIAAPDAAPDAFMMFPFARLLEGTSAQVLEVAWMIVAVALVAAAAALPRQVAALLPIFVGLGLVATSVVASSEIGKLTRIDDDRFFGTASQTWVNDVATGPVTYLFDGSAYWNGVWKTAFWNDRIRKVVRFPDATGGSLPATVVVPRFDGALFSDKGVRWQSREIVASTALTFIGELRAEIAQRDLDQAGLRLWRTPGPPRLSTWTTGLKPNGDIVETVRVYVYDCDRGRLELTLLGKQGAPIEIDVDGTLARRIPLAPGGVWNGSVPAPNNVDGPKRCTFEIRSPGLVGSTRIAFVRA